LFFFGRGSLALGGVPDRPRRGAKCGGFSGGQGLGGGPRGAIQCEPKIILRPSHMFPWATVGRALFRGFAGTSPGPWVVKGGGGARLAVVLGVWQLRHGGFPLGAQVYSPLRRKKTIFPLVLLKRFFLRSKKGGGGAGRGPGRASGSTHKKPVSVKALLNPECGRGDNPDNVLSKATPGGFHPGLGFGAPGRERAIEFGAAGRGTVWPLRAVQPRGTVHWVSFQGAGAADEKRIRNRGGGGGTVASAPKNAFPWRGP